MGASGLMDLAGLSQEQQPMLPAVLIVLLAIAAPVRRRADVVTWQSCDGRSQSSRGLRVR